jgi:hypothetical protein
MRTPLLLACDLASLDSLKEGLSFPNDDSQKGLNCNTYPLGLLVSDLRGSGLVWNSDSSLPSHPERDRLFACEEAGESKDPYQCAICSEPSLKPVYRSPDQTLAQRVVAELCAKGIPPEA